jgi:nitrate reductase (cytochrome), electron transfer subunit
MKTINYGMILGLALAFSAIGGPDATSQEGGVQSLRGTPTLKETGPSPDIKKQATNQRFGRAYRQQPPLIPHKIEKYQINLKVNQCMRCHDWPYSVDEGAPKISETHYIDRSGVALDKVAKTRWFCTQCHVPQARTRALVPNRFKSAFDTK